ncbi:TPA: hypothetical protein ACG5JQ_002347 [Stenotrophomonas maltophilia]|uniref:Uncharacterized protein n=1 Tax=Stenotrophomonas maltophilia TaxID=40324 RepID=A0AAI9G064_STEMA|nr:hypothetical protein [Stenotrophomonas maltophilia]MPS46282.1 hypothetical protein [Stenotrophomonas sp.]EKT4442111.1 hypothetical protein [Stenotrophomonas maltophilia]MBN5012891.1 hypothetical protein [Stenotrophomonas maltophilia]QPX95014.1 hypothetical protein HUZ96_19915 [Stenotrophomonas maltophilia]HDS1083347.1 hypothetical protein [Stenotrophomonas maltophilia]
MDRILVRGEGKTTRGRRAWKLHLKPVVAGASAAIASSQPFMDRRVMLQRRIIVVHPQWDPRCCNAGRNACNDGIAGRESGVQEFGTEGDAQVLRQ